MFEYTFRILPTLILWWNILRLDHPRQYKIWRALRGVWIVFNKFLVSFAVQSKLQTIDPVKTVDFLGVLCV
jgi:hypothetical protein